MAASACVKILAVIPARFSSTRFPGKMIMPLAGKPLVVHTYERTRRSALVAEVVVATDDERVVSALRPFDVPVVMTRRDHPSGTDRIAEVAESSDADIIVNVQGDEPLIAPATIDNTIRPLLEQPDVQVSTARRRITRLEDLRDPNVVKVVCGANSHALYFSRSPIPHIREASDAEASCACYWQHIGLYVYRRGFLLRYATMPPTPLEKLECLEQLRILENGFSIAVVETPYESIGVDAPEDLERVRVLLEHDQKEETV